MMNQVFCFDEKRKFIISTPVVKQLLNYRQSQQAHVESGGLLIGRHLHWKDNIIVDYITKPSWFDKQLRRLFFRSKYHNLLLKRRWIKSQKTQTLLGTWHTHPEPIPTPSTIDYKDWGNLLQKGSFVGDFLFFLIVGIQEIKVWQGNRELQFVELKENNGK